MSDVEQEVKSEVAKVEQEAVKVEASLTKLARYVAVALGGGLITLIVEHSF